MPRKKNGSQDAQSVAQIIDKFSTGLRDDLSKLYQMGFEAGAVSERKRIASVFQGDAVSKATVFPKSDPAKDAVRSPKKLRKNPWAAYTPEQKAERLKNLAAAREKARAGKQTEQPVAGEPEPVAAGEPGVYPL